MIGSRFRVIDPEVSGGGMSVVHRGIDLERHALVAIKVLDQGVEDARFRREAAILESLSHPALVYYVDHGSVDGKRFLVMDWIDGIPLGQAIAQRGLSIAGVRDLGMRVSEGLAAAHERGITHRDLKPSNVVLEGGRASGARVIDFGIALPADGSQRLTAPGIALGTPSYMAPEQARGDAVDYRCDLFSAGALLYEALTGIQPFASTTDAGARLKVLLATPQAPADLSEQVPAAFSDLIMRMLHKDPRGRPRDFTEVGAHLASIPGDDTILVRPTTRDDEPTRPVHSRHAGLVLMVDPQVHAATASTPPRDVQLEPVAGSFAASLMALSASVQVCTLAGTSAAEVALRAARAALAFRARAPHLCQVVATSPIDATEALIDEGARTLELEARQAAAGSLAQGSIRVHGNLAHILESRFVIRLVGTASYIIEERV